MFGRIVKRIGAKKLSLAATLLLALTNHTSATTIILNPTQVGQSSVIDYNGLVNNVVVPGLTASVTFTLTSVDLLNNTWSFGYALDNTSSGGISSRVSTFGFNTDPALLAAAITGGTVFSDFSSGNVPNLGSVDFCATAGSNCAGGGGGGVFPVDGIVTGSFSLDFAGSANNATQITLSDLYVRYQSITGTTLGNSGIGVATVPGPLVGAGLPGLVAACGFLVALARRRRRQTS